MDPHEQLMGFFSITNKINDFYTHLALQSGLSESEHWTLYFIRQSLGPCTSKSVCDQWSLRKQTVHSALKALQKKGLITLNVLEEDRRSKEILLTPEGVSFAETYLDPIFAAEKSAFMRMEESTRCALIKGSKEYLTKLRANLEEQKKRE
ncbi:MarR family transcriptional regulator [Clostridium sp. E02]|uniref:MarR family winged helix-turn-helix transcriptional regulator n=1 Tax=Clostridium sp. E02 TaxID=2487134 RepID=UPI000F52F4FC|nr:MarR family transcriptional regulator [Clostridium sp. E02]